VKGRSGVDAAIVFVLQDGRTKEVPLKAHGYIVGRATDCALRLPESSVSRKHAEITFDGSELKVEDLGSSRGTFVNGEKISSVTTLSAGDAVAIGSTVFLVRINDEPENYDAAKVWREGQPAAVVESARPAAGQASDAEPDTDASSMMDAGELGDDSDAGGSGSGFGSGLLGADSDPEGSSFGDFDFDLLDDDDEDDQPKL